jgi:hypothetical protein
VFTVGQRIWHVRAALVRRERGAADVTVANPEGSSN